MMDCFTHRLSLTVLSLTANVDHACTKAERDSCRRCSMEEHCHIFCTHNEKAQGNIGRSNSYPVDELKQLIINKQKLQEAKTSNPKNHNTSGNS